MIGAFWSFGMIGGVGLAKSFPMQSQRLLIFYMASFMSTSSGIMAAHVVAYRRLTGFWDNGLRWTTPENKFKKFDNTSVFEKATGWDKYRVRG